MNEIRNLALMNKKYKEFNPVDYGEQQCEPGHSYGPAIRKYTLIHYVFSGKGVFINQNGTYTVTAGKAFLIRPGEVTTYKADGETPWSYIWIGFDGEMSDEFHKLPDILDPSAAVFAEMRKVFEYRGTAEEYLAGKLFELYAGLFNGENNSENYILKIYNFVETNYNTRCDVSDIASAMNLERHYLARLFKQKTGTTLKSYITAKRMEEAKKLLTAGQKVSYVAQMTGYADTFTFSKMFKKQYGLSPVNWVQSNIKNRS